MGLVPRESKAALVVGCCCLAAAVAPYLYGEDVMTLDDGTCIRGTLVGYDEGAKTYLMQIGRLTKRVPEARVRAFSDTTAAAAVVPTPSRPEVDADRERLLAEQRAAFAEVGASRVTRVVGGGGRGSDDERHAAGEAKERRNGAPYAAGNVSASGAPPRELADVLDLSKRLQSESPLFRRILERQQSGAPAGLDPAALASMNPNDVQGLVNNPSLARITERFRDPAYQRTLLDQLRRAPLPRGATAAERDQRLKTISNLFDQLRALQGTATPP